MRISDWSSDVCSSDLPASDDKARGRTVVSDDIGERELEILVSAVDHLHRRRHRGNRGERLGHRNPTGEGSRHQEGDFRLDAWVDEVSERKAAPFLDQHLVGESAPSHLVDAHLLHLGPARETHFDADTPLAALEATIDGQSLDFISVLNRQLGSGMGQLRRSHAFVRGPVQDFGQTCQIAHCDTASSWSRTRSRATSTIISSWPPTIRRLPSSTRIWRVSRPYCSAAFSAWRRKLE